LEVGVGDDPTGCGCEVGVAVGAAVGAAVGVVPHGGGLQSLHGR
jgi:hypothetical protein